MGEIAEAMLNGEMCAQCSVPIECEDHCDMGCPVYCSLECAKDSGLPLKGLVICDCICEECNGEGFVEEMGDGENFENDVIGTRNCSTCSDNS